MQYVVIQIAQGIHPRDPRVPSCYTKTGVLLPVSCDGFYSNAEAAHSVAKYLADQWPALQTVVAQVVVSNSPRYEEPNLPDLPRVGPSDNEAPPPFIDPAKERAKMSPKVRYEVIRRDGYRCRACGFGVQDGAHLHVDHIVAIANGGATAMDNLQTLCTVCNLGKGAA